VTRRAAKSIDLTLERDIQRDVVELYERLGCIVKPTSGGRRRGTRNAPGLPDLYVFPPSIDPQPVPGFPSFRMTRAPFWHETKRPSGKQKPTQIEFQQLCEARGVGYVLGGTEAALEQLRLIGLLTSPGRS